MCLDVVSCSEPIFSACDLLEITQTSSCIEVAGSIKYSQGAFRVCYNPPRDQETRTSGALQRSDVEELQLSPKMLMKMGRTRAFRAEIFVMWRFKEYSKLEKHSFSFFPLPMHESSW